jgi:phosphoribosylformylglycinamidine synthase PurS subunit
MGFKGVNSVRQGKTIELDLDSTDPKKALKTTKEMCENLLSNTVIEDYFIEIV